MALPGSPATAGVRRVETPVVSNSPVTGVIETLVRLRIPVPASAGPQPAECDWIPYLRDFLNFLNFLTGKPSIEDFRLTNAVALGALMDDNPQPLAFLETGVGFFAGGKVADKDIPFPNDVGGNPALISTSLARVSAEPLPFRT
ncbi:MAG TPA: hypothetical protein VJT49_02855 [Amycolatopsis sp.]|uniref:hypothetical protein n=1 Tax=Amycolatopsis sp. TaxID=37632 RepID=UPI002B4834A6|nr:hypothetical protein [Amycolatopsis sp.]HKS44054.1 hypothetical protein [Amycolatopsis sp.]